MESIIIPLEVWCNILSNITNVYEILAIADAYSINKEFKDTLIGCVTHIDIMEKNGGKIRYEEYLRIIEALEDFVYIKSYNLHLLFDKEYPQIAELELAKEQLRSGTYVGNLEDVKLLEMFIQGTINDDITAILDDDRLKNYEIIHNLVSDWSSSKIYNGVGDKIVSNSKKYGDNFYNIYNNVSYAYGVLDHPRQFFPRELVNVPVHTLSYPHGAIYAKIPIETLIHNKPYIIFEALKINAKANGGATIKHIVYRDDTVRSNLDMRSNTSFTFSKFVGLVYPKVETFDYAIPRSYLNVMRNAFPNVQEWTIED